MAEPIAKALSRVPYVHAKDAMKCVTTSETRKVQFEGSVRGMAHASEKTVQRRSDRKNIASRRKRRPYSIFMRPAHVNWVS